MRPFDPINIYKAIYHFNNITNNKQSSILVTQSKNKHPIIDDIFYFRLLIFILYFDSSNRLCLNAHVCTQNASYRLIRYILAPVEHSNLNVCLHNKGSQHKHKPKTTWKTPNYIHRRQQYWFLVLGKVLRLKEKSANISLVQVKYWYFIESVQKWKNAHKNHESANCLMDNNQNVESIL